MTKAKTFYQKLIDVQKKIKQPKFNKSVNYKQTNFKYADLSAVYDACKDLLLEEGILISHIMSHSDSNVFLTTILSDGTDDMESSTLIMIDGQTMQQIGSQITYLKRYQLSGLLGIVAEEDDDAKSLEDQPLRKTISIKQVLEIESLIDGNVELLKTILKKERINRLNEFPLEKYEKLINWLSNLGAN